MSKVIVFHLGLREASHRDRNYVDKEKNKHNLGCS